MDRASIIFNPTARNAPSRQRLLQAAGRQRLNGWEVDVLESLAPMHCAELAREAAAAGSSVVFACGGDGTVNEVVNGLYGTPACLGILRAGTGNVFGKEVRVPRKLENALDVLSGGREYRFDLGFAEGPEVVGAGHDGRRYFLLMCGLGFDGAVVARVPKWPKRWLGTTSYILWGAAEAMRFKSRPVRVVLDDVAWESNLYWMLLGNTRSYGGVANVALKAMADDGMLDAYLFSGGGLGWIIAMGIRIALRRHQQHRDVHFARSSSIRIETPGLQVQADGEYFGATPVAFGVQTRALSVLLFPGGPDPILAGN